MLYLNKMYGTEPVNRGTDNKTIHYRTKSQNTKEKTKHLSTRTPEYMLRYSGSVNKTCSTNCTRRVTYVKHRVINHEIRINLPHKSSPVLVSISFNVQPT